MEERFKNSYDLSQRKMEIDDENYKRHKKNTNNKILKYRNNQCEINSNNDKDVSMTNSIVDVNLLLSSLNYLLSTNNNKNDKFLILKYLKNVRKELAKQEIYKEVINIIIQKFQNIIEIFSMFILDFKNSEIQFETIWILNNLSIYCYKYNLELHFFQIAQILIQILQFEKNFSNNGVKNLIFEKLFCFIGNLVFMDEKTLMFFLDNNIISYLFQNLNSSVCSLRCVCLCSLNKIYSEIIKKQNFQKFITLYIDKNAMFYYKFILSRLEIKRNFDEIYEFYWLINSIIKTHPEIATYLFFVDHEKEIIKKFNNLVSITLVNILIQPCIRLISNLLVLSNNQIIRDNLCQALLSNVPLVSFISNLLISPINKNEMSIYKDVLLLLFNLSCFVPAQIKQIFYDSIITMLSNNGNFQDLEIFKLSLNIFYRIFIENGKIFDDKNKIIIQILLSQLQYHINDINILLIITDLLYLFVKNVNHINNNTIDNAIKVIESKEGNMDINEIIGIIKEISELIN